MNFLSEFLWWEIIVTYIIYTRIVVLIFVVIITTFQPLCTPSSIRWLSIQVTFMEFGSEQFIYYSWMILCVPLSMDYLVLYFIMARIVSTKSPLQDSGTELTITISRKASTKNLIY